LPILDRTTLSLDAQLGTGDDVLQLATHGYEEARAKLNNGPADDGKDRMAATFVLPGQEAPRRRQLVTLHSVDLTRILGVGYAVGDVSLEGQECLVFFLGGIPDD
jgi:hypothetical protein